MSEEYIGEYIPQLIGEKIAEYIEAPKTLSLVIAVTYIISISISCLVLNTVIKSHDEEVAKLISAEVYDTIHNDILRSIMVTRTMANDSFLKQNLQNELNISQAEEVTLLQNYLNGIKENFGYTITFIVSDATKIYYYDGGFNKVLNPKNPRDIWYKNFLAKNLPYATDIDADEFDQESWNLFVNSRIEDADGNLIGVCGIGIAMDELQEILTRQEHEHKIKIDLFQPDANFDIDTSAVKFKDPYLKEIISAVQENEDFDNNQFNVRQLENIFVVARYIPEANSYLIVRRDNTYVRGTFSDLVLQIIAYSVFILFVLIIFVQVNIGKEHKKVKEESKRQGITSHADKYASMHLIDLKYNSVQEVSRHEGFNLLKIRDGGNAARKFRNALLSTTKYETLRGLLDFINFDNLAYRMEGKHGISYEFLSKDYGWCKAKFLLLDDKGGDLSQILFAIEVIDAEKRSAEDLKRRSETDLMTGLRNRGSGEKAIKELIANGVGGMFCLMDADKFKSINDNYGHDVGDKVIKAIANALKRTFRKNDIVMRLGGDEYAVYAVDVPDEDYGANIIIRLFKEIDDIFIAELGDRKISISLGSALFHAGEKLSFEELYKRADLATYESKKVKGNYHTAYSKELSERE
mgnify:CR=1 FL=1